MEASTPDGFPREDEESSDPWSVGGGILDLANAPLPDGHAGRCNEVRRYDDGMGEASGVAEVVVGEGVENGERDLRERSAVGCWCGGGPRGRLDGHCVLGDEQLKRTDGWRGCQYQGV